VLIASANKAIACIKGSCVEAEEVFVKQSQMSKEGQDAFDLLKKDVEINSPDQDLTDRTTLPETPTEGTTNAGGEGKTVDSDNQKPEILTDPNGFFKPIELISTTEGNGAQSSATDGNGNEATDKGSATPKSNNGNEATKITQDGGFFNTDAINDYIEDQKTQPQSQGTEEDSMKSTTTEEGTEDNSAGTTSQGSDFFKDGAVDDMKNQVDDINNQASGSSPQNDVGQTTDKSGDGFFKDGAFDTVKGTTPQNEVEGTTTTVDGTDNKHFIDLGHSGEMFKVDKIKEELDKMNGGQGQTLTDFCQEGALNGAWLHVDENQKPKPDKPEKMIQNSVVFSDGHGEGFTCVFDKDNGTTISFTMTVQGEASTYTGAVSSDGKLISWNDGDHWQKIEGSDDVSADEAAPTTTVPSTTRLQETMKNMGSGCCRYDGWESPVSKGYLTEEECTDGCLADEKCYFADIARKNSEGKYDCYYFTKELQKDDNLRLECNTASEEEKCFQKVKEVVS